MMKISFIRPKDLKIIPYFKFSVLMAVYKSDDLHLLEMAVNSIYNNTIKPAQFLLVIDGPVSSPMQSKILFLKEKFNFEVLSLKVNLGLGKALNEGLKYIRFRYCFRADSDDINLPKRFESQIKFAQKGYKLIGSSIQEIDLNGNLLKVRRAPRTARDIKKFAIYRNPFNHMSVLFDVNEVRKVGGYPKWRFKQDYGLWVKLISKNIKMINIDDILVHATAGDNLYMRRSGFAYVINEIQLQSLLYKFNLTSPIQGFIVGITRSSFILMPCFIKRFLYNHLFRD